MDGWLAIARAFGDRHRRATRPRNRLERGPSALQVHRRMHVLLDSTSAIPAHSDVCAAPEIQQPDRTQTEALMGEPTRSSNYSVYTSQETDVLMRSAADGARNANWSNDEQAQSRVYDIANSHYVRISLASGESLEDLATITESVDADSCLIVFCVLGILAPDSPLAGNLRSGRVVDLLDVARRTGILFRDGKKEREAAACKVWNTIVFGARAEVCGERTTIYIDKATRETISTRLESCLWCLGAIERAAQPAVPDIPLRAEIILTKDWERSLFDSNLAQYLPCGELIGAIPARRASGAWARVMGLALVNLWRRNPSKALDGSLRPTRGELLGRYTPASNTPEEILWGSNPKRAAERWAQALNHLAAKGLIQRSAEVTREVNAVTSVFRRKNWRALWLKERVELLPGPALEDVLRQASPRRRRRLTASRKGRGQG